MSLAHLDSYYLGGPVTPMSKGEEDEYVAWREDFNKRLKKAVELEAVQGRPDWPHEVHREYLRALDERDAEADRVEELMALLKRLKAHITNPCWCGDLHASESSFRL